jgi:alpha-N-arabinofuranosidase
MMTHCADHMDLVSEHFYVREQPGLISHVAQTRRRVRDIAAAHRRYRQEFDSLKGKDIRIALDEWNYWYGPHLYGELGVRYFLRDALGVGAALNEFARNTDMYFMANYAQTVNVIGAIKTSRTHASMGPVGHLLTLYRARVGGHLLPVEVAGDAPIDAVAAWDAPSRTLSMGLINYSPKDEVSVKLNIDGAGELAAATAWRIHGPSLGAINVPGEPEQVTTTQLAEPLPLDQPVVLPAHSITVLQTRR